MVSFGPGIQPEALLQPQEPEVHHVGYVDEVVSGVDGVGKGERRA